MEYKNIYLALLGILGGIFWAIEYWKLFKTPQIVVPPSLKKSNSISRMLLFVVGIIAWLFISYAITGPRKALDYTPDTIEVNDIFFCCGRL
jgi:Ca-activated chloride channel family protein